MTPRKLSQLKPEGRVRAVIENVTPEVDAGRFPAKRAVGQWVDVEVDVFADGHDKVAGDVLYRPADQKDWQRASLSPLDNDRYTARFQVTELGRYEYTVEAWVDPFATWRAGSGKAPREPSRTSRSRSPSARSSSTPPPRAAEPPSGRAPGRLGRRSAGRGGRRAGAATPPNEPQLARAHARAPRQRKRCGATSGCWRCWWSGRARASVPGTSSSRAPAASSEAARHVRRLRERLDTSPAGLRRRLPAAHPSHRPDRPQGSQQRPSRRSHRSRRQSLGHRRGRGRPQGVHPELGTLEDFRELVAQAAALGLEVALDIAFQCAPDHPYVEKHPDWFRHRPDGTIQYAENPPKSIRTSIPSISSPRIAKRCGRSSTAWWSSGSSRACASSGWTIRTPSLSGSGNG